MEEVIEEGEEEEEDEDMSVEDEGEEEGGDFEGVDEDEFETGKSTPPLSKIHLSEVCTCVSYLCDFTIDMIKVYTVLKKYEVILHIVPFTVILSNTTAYISERR